MKQKTTETLYQQQKRDPVIYNNSWSMSGENCAILHQVETNQHLRKEDFSVASYLWMDYCLEKLHWAQKLSCQVGAELKY